MRRNWFGIGQDTTLTQLKMALCIDKNNKKYRVWGTKVHTDYWITNVFPPSPTEIWTRIAGFKVQSANHYTMGPQVEWSGTKPDLIKTTSYERVWCLNINFLWVMELNKIQIVFPILPLSLLPYVFLQRCRPLELWSVSEGNIAHALQIQR